MLLCVSSRLVYNKQMRYIFLFLFIPVLALADTSGVYSLEKGQTISGLLHDQLGISPIYGKGKALSEVLRFNSLSFKQARALPAGHVIKVPDHMIKKEVPDPVEPASQKVPDEEPKAALPPEEELPEVDPIF